jgi:hypothetical protein
MSQKQALGLFVKDESPVIICHCGFICGEGEVEVDDYVASNCLIWCDNCCEVLICPTGYNSTSEIDQLADGFEGGCSKKISRDQAQNMFPYIDFDDVVKKNFPYCKNPTVYYYSIGIIHLTGITNDFDDGIDEDDLVVNAKFIDVSADSFKEIPEDVDCDHGGTYLAYRGYCNNCSRECQSYIWGD